MAGSVIGALRVNLGLDSAQFEKGAKRSQNTLKTMRTQFLAISGAAAAMGTALSAAALKGAADIDKAAKSARRLDSSIGGFRALELAAGEAGVSLETLTDSVQTMDREIAKGTKSAGQALAALGLQAKDLEGLEADQKIALVADSIEKMGLTTAQTSAVLQMLGIRNREMVLAVAAGGGAFRNARADIEDYGLAVSDVDASKIEAANDAIGRLGLIGQYAGQQLAIALVPAMGRLAQAMTDSLREGGLLREVIDGLVANLDRMAVYVGVAVTAFGVRYVAAFAAAKLATFTLTGALAALRAALIRTGIGVAVVAVGELVLWLGRARAATGSFGAAFEKIGLQVKAAAFSMKAWFIGAINDMVGRFIDFTWTVADGLNSLFGTSLQGANSLVTQELGLAFKAAEDAAASATAAANALNITLEDTEEKTDAAAGGMADLGDASGGAAKKIKEAKTEAEKLAEELERNLESAVSSVADAWGDFVVRGFRDFKGFASSVLDSFKGMISQMIAIAARNRIMIGLGLGGSGIGTAASAAGGILGGGSGLLGGITSLAGQGGFLGALGGVGSGLGGILSGGGLGASFANLGGLLSGSVSGAGAIGAALPAIGLAIAAPLAIASFLKKSRKQLDTGLNVAVDGTNTNAQSFNTIQTKRFWGLSKKTSTSFGAADPAVAQAIGDVQGAVQSMAGALGVGADVFKGFTYSFNLSLQGLSADEAAQKVAEQVASLGDAFAGMIPYISSVNELMAVTQERYALETRLLQLQGDTAELRRRELESVNFYNRAILQQIYDLEDAAAAVAAFSNNANNFVTRADQVFAATSAGFTSSTVEVETTSLLRDLITAVREGDINNARLTTRLVQIEERRELEPTV